MPPEGQRNYTAVRTVLITYGVAAFGYLFTRPVPAATLPAFGGSVSAQVLMLLGIGMQLVLLVAGALVRRQASGRAAAARVLAVLELVGDGLTVLIYALCTYGAILNTAASI